MRCERAVPQRADLGAAFAPAMRTNDDAGSRLWLSRGAGALITLRGLDRYAVAIGDAGPLRAAGPLPDGCACGPAEINTACCPQARRPDPLRAQAVDSTRILRDHHGDLRKDSVQRLIQALHHGFGAGRSWSALSCRRAGWRLRLSAAAIRAGYRPNHPFRRTRACACRVAHLRCARSRRALCSSSRGRSSKIKGQADACLTVTDS